MKRYIILHAGDFLNDPPRPYKKRVDIIEEFKYKGEWWFIINEEYAPNYWYGKYCLTHAETGYRACNSNSKRGLKKELTQIMKKYSLKKYVEKAKNSLIKGKIKFPVNKIESC